ncbi:MAG: hypothetical protein JSS49_16385 [Planctomycetes bacterium]|nr:hypothetical protein [Planctomycetota bacterium]
MINNPREFKVRRSGIRKGEEIVGWFPMAKGVSNMPRYREVCLAANRRYLEALSVVPDPGQLKERIQAIGQRIQTASRSHRALNPANKHDIELLATVMRGEFQLQGFRNADISAHLNTPSEDATERRRQRNRTGRLLKILHSHRLIAKIPRTRRWKVTNHGQAIMSSMLTVHYDYYPANKSNRS